MESSYPTECFQYAPARGIKSQSTGDHDSSTFAYLKKMVSMVLKNLLIWFTQSAH